MAQKTKTVRMTEGKITPLIIRFAIPLLLGNIFQQLYLTGKKTPSIVL